LTYTRKRNRALQIQISMLVSICLRLPIGILKWPDINLVILWLILLNQKSSLFSLQQPKCQF
jgi:hypothetical protein